MVGQWCIKCEGNRVKNDMKFTEEARLDSQFGVSIRWLLAIGKTPSQHQSPAIESVSEQFNVLE